MAYYFTKGTTSPLNIFVYNDGTIERPTTYPRALPSLEDPATGVPSKDILFSKNPFFFARLYLPKLTQPHQKIPILVYLASWWWLLL